MSINHTRINLINTRRAIALASKGHALLKRKREALVSEFLSLIKESSVGRRQLESVMGASYGALAMAFAFSGELELEQSALHVPESTGVAITIKNIMGVKIPEVHALSLDDQARAPQASAAIDDAGTEFGNALLLIIDVARREQGLKRLAIEIEKVKRRVNALEYVRLPALRAQARYISMMLDEMDRDTFAALKHIKKRLESAAEQRP